MLDAGAFPICKRGKAVSVRRKLSRILAVAFAVAAFGELQPAAQEVDAGDTGAVVLMAAIEGPIGPATVRHVTRVISLAEERQAAALVLRLNTPGGLADAMREIISEVMASTVPVIGYVAPPGAHAASAGTYILYATHIAAMAPGTNVGAATPVQIGGMPEGLPGSEPAKDQGSGEEADTPKSPQDTMTAKATNDAVALIRSLAESHGRNADWAESAVREAASLSSAKALEMDVIDILAGDLDALLEAADGRMVEVAGVERRLAVAGRKVETVEMDAITRVLSVLSNPNVALILMMIGVYGLIFEFWSPGAVVPGVVGAICLTLGLYALNQLPLDYAGLALIALGIAFMVAEALTPAFGILGFGGLIAFVLGASMLVDTDVPAYQISWWLIGIVSAISGAILVLLLGFTLHAYRTRPVSGRARMIDAPGRVLEWDGGSGFVWVEGERWQAQGTESLAPGQTVRVCSVDGLTLIVESASDTRPNGRG
ncbi:NfeD family protein [Defluviimonas salinarum]|uniref:Nodulation protein NfeD n=1 Tax=Defluviimonas salinarum TaxID=2992147 RepID=A0ABT3JAI6_9RHOB|nr:nodulation protein NfeD [Defluviimonas salinarum]MCW3784419.1 nodulation protein NfeD [Defluviimonas salinarum]